MVVSVNYEDKFGPLGTIAVIAGVVQGERLAVETWVMSCRAFARRIEHQTLKMLFESTGAERSRFRLHAHGKERPVYRSFLLRHWRETDGSVPVEARAI